MCAGCDREAKVASEQEALVAFLRGLALTIVRVGLEAGPCRNGSTTACTRAGFEAVLLETQHVKAALSAMAVKTDRRATSGITQLLPALSTCRVEVAFGRDKGGVLAAMPQRRRR